MKMHSALFALVLSGVPRLAEAAGPIPVVERPFVVVVDPGHGGSNAGCVSFDGQTHEKDLTLVMAHQLRAELERQIPHAKVVVTRRGDETVTLLERVQRANAAQADLFISVHANASLPGTQHGFETYILDVSRGPLEAARTAPVGERRAHAQAQRMVHELTQSLHYGRSARFAHRVQHEQAKRFPERIDRGIKPGTFDVLLGLQMPAVLFEAGFLDHPDDGSLLLHDDTRAQMIDGLADAIIGFYREHARQK